MEDLTKEKEPTQIENPSDKENANKFGESNPARGLSDSTSYCMEERTNNESNNVPLGDLSDKTLTDTQTSPSSKTGEAEDLGDNIDHTTKEGDLSPRQVNNLKRDTKKAYEPLPL